MYFITDEKDLEGKTIAFTHLARFADKLSIFTTDGGIIVIEVDEDGDGKRTYILSEALAKNYVFDTDKNKWMIKELVKREIFKEDELQQYEKEQKEKQEKELENYRKKLEERDELEFKRLKEKFEGK